ncbi:uncharacterized protein LOC134712433 [Mytilus trossulus]|uniref:uncharacterized protein LOC134712433 n=1 Tax=Mytilus trossulus TaxID=6551 RepID=UPI0030044E82
MSYPSRLLELLLVVFLCDGLFTNHQVHAINKVVHFTDEDCDEYRHYLKSEDDQYEVHWDGEPYPSFCSLRFKLMTGGDTYKICAKITTLDLPCKGPKLAYYYASDKKSYTCTDSPPVNEYCDDLFIYMKLAPYEIANTEYYASKVRITITATLISRYGEDSNEGTGIAVGVCFGIAMIVFLVIVFYCVYKRRQAALRQLEQSGGVVVLGRQGNMVIMAAPVTYANNDVSVPFQDQPMVQQFSDNQRTHSGNSDFQDSNVQNSLHDNHQQSAPPPSYREVTGYK